MIGLLTFSLGTVAALGGSFTLGYVYRSETATDGGGVS